MTDRGARVVPNAAVTFRLVYQDPLLVVLDKPPGLPTAPGKGHADDTLLNGLVARFPQLVRTLGARHDFGLVHRLDRAASGLLVVALTVPAHDHLCHQWRHRHARKYYWAVVRGGPRRDRGLIRRPLLECSQRRSRYVTVRLARISSQGKPALTAYRVLARAPAASLLELRPVTGRLHQLRVHLASIHCPILGDEFYAPPAVRRAAPRLALHAHRLVFDHPATDEPIDVSSPCPRDLRALLRRLGLPPPCSVGRGSG